MRDYRNLTTDHLCDRIAALSDELAHAVAERNFRIVAAYNDPGDVGRNVSAIARRFDVSRQTVYDLTRQQQQL